MTTVVIIIHIILTIALVGIVLIQRSEGGALGMGGGGGGGGFMTGRSAANMLTRVTTWLAAGFFVTSLSLAIMANGNHKSKSVLDKPAAQTTQAPKSPAKPEGPSVPLAK